MLSPDPSAYKPTLPPTGRFTLPGWSVLAVEGADAAAFLQAQTMNDVRALRPRQWHWNGWLNPKGRLHALFALLRTGEASFALLVPDLPALELGAALQRFVFRSKLRLDASDAWCVEGEFAGAAAHAAADADMAEPAAGDAWTLDMAGGRRLHVSRDALADPSAGGTLANASADAWFEQDLRHGLPRLPAAQREAWTPQMLSLQRLHAYSLSKGCYPGQEIVARTHYLGQAKRSLHLVEGDGLVAGEPVRSASGQALGSIVCVHPQGRLALGVLGEFNHAETLESSGGSVRHLALSEGLQRPL